MATRLRRKQAAKTMAANAGEEIHRTIGKLTQLLATEDSEWIESGLDSDFNVRPIIEAVLRLDFYVADFRVHKATIEALTEVEDPN